MYKLNDMVLYGSDGVCQIQGTTERNLSGNRLKYYILKPVYNDATIYVPINNEKLTAKMQHVLSAEEIYSLIKSMPTESTIWIDDEKVRRESYKDIVASGNRTKLIQLIKTLHLHRQTLKEQGKKLHVTDERFMKEAEKMLHEEFAHVLNLEIDQVLDLILEQLRDNNSNNN